MTDNERAVGNEDGIPRDWSYNPSSWSQRLPIVGLAMIGFSLRFIWRFINGASLKWSGSHFSVKEAE